MEISQCVMLRYSQIQGDEIIKVVEFQKEFVEFVKSLASRIDLDIDSNRLQQVEVQRFGGTNRWLCDFDIFDGKLNLSSTINVLKQISEIVNDFCVKNRKIEFAVNCGIFNHA